VNVITKFSSKLVAWAGAMKHAADIRDFLVLSGLLLFSYGLWLLRPWLGFTAAGFLLMVIGYFMERKE